MDARLGVGGVWPATITPFRPDLAIDEGAFTALVRRLGAVDGITGIVVNGVAGEVTSLSPEEQERVVALAVEAAGALPVVAGLQAETAAGAVDAVARSQRAGAAAVLVQAPAVFARGIGLAPEVALAYFKEVVSVGVPIILFQHQVGTNRNYPLPLLLRLLELEHVVAVKETIWDAEQYEREVRAIRRHRPETRIFCANDTILLPSLAFGAHDGVLVGFASLVPELIVDLAKAIERGDLKSAQATNDRLAPLTAAIYASPSINYYSRMKAAMVMLGSLPHATVRPPLQPTGADERARIADALREAGLLA